LLDLVCYTAYFYAQQHVVLNVAYKHVHVGLLAFVILSVHLSITTRYRSEPRWETPGFQFSV